MEKHKIPVNYVGGYLAFYRTGHNGFSNNYMKMDWLKKSICLLTGVKVLEQF